jgi:hypothetical protein
MKKLVLAALATSLLAVAAPALAHPGDDDDWTIESYSSFAQQYHHIWDGIEHGLSDGSYSPRQARYFYQQLRDIQRRADWEQRAGRFDPDEISDRLEALHDRMHVAHERGHERLDNDWGYGGYRPYYGPR